MTKKKLKKLIAKAVKKAVAELPKPKRGKRGPRGAPGPMGAPGLLGMRGDTGTCSCSQNLK